MAYKIILLEEARFEVAEAALFYKQFGKELSDDILARFFETIEIITEGPLLFQTNKKGYRKANLKRFPYKIVFKLVDDNIVVVAFAHHKRKPRYWKNR